jgi:hypothetical protein
MLLSKGEAAARDLAAELGISDSTTNAYISHFLKHSTNPISRRDDASKKTEGKSPSRSSKLRPISSAFSDKLGERVLVYDIGEPRRYGIIKEFGPEVSKVDWQSPGWSNPFTSNAFLHPVKENEKERRADLKKRLASLRDQRVIYVKEWITSRPKAPTDKELWVFIRAKWPGISREDAEDIYQEC